MIKSPTIQHLILERVHYELQELQNIHLPTSLGFRAYYDIFNGLSVRVISNSFIRPSDSVNDNYLPRVFLDAGVSVVRETETLSKLYTFYNLTANVIIRSETGAEALTRINNYHQHYLSPPVTTGLTMASDLDTWQTVPDRIDEDGTVTDARKTIDDIYIDKQADALLTGKTQVEAYDFIRFMQIKSMANVVADVENAFKLIAITLNSVNIDKKVDYSGNLQGYYTTIAGEQLEAAEFLSLSRDPQDDGSDRRHIRVELGFLVSKDMGV